MCRCGERSSVTLHKSTTLESTLFCRKEPGERGLPVAVCWWFTVEVFPILGLIPPSAC